MKADIDTSSALLLPEEIFRELFPFHVAFDRAGRVTRLGPSLARLAPGLRVGLPLSTGLEPRRPDRLPDHDSLAEDGKRLVILRERARGVPLRGQLVPLGEEVFYLCTPWITDAAEMQRLGLNLHDFALHDPTADLVQLVQVQCLAAADLRRLADRLTATRDELRASEAEARKLALIAAHTGSSVVLADAKGRVEWVNEGFVRITGYNLDDVRGLKPGAVLQGPGSDQATVARMRERIARGEGFHEEILNYRKDGTTYWVEIDMQPIREASGQIANLISIQTDITRRKQLEFSLRESEERFALALNATGEGVWDWNLPADTVRHNQRWLDLLGLGPEYLEHNLARFSERIHPEDRDTVLRRVRACLAGEGPYLSRHRMLRADGTEIWVEDRGDVAQRGPDGAPLRLIGSIADITERHLADESLRVQFGLARSLASASSVAEAGVASLPIIGEEMGWSLGVLWLVDTTGERLACAASHAPAGGETPEPLRRRFSRSLPAREGLIGRACGGGEVLHSTAPVAAAPFAGVVAVPMHAAGQKVGALEFFTHDKRPPAAARIRTLAALGTQLAQFVERVRAEDSLRRRGEELLAANAGLARASRVKDALLASLSDELRGPLRAILGHSGSLLAQTAGPLTEEQVARLEQISEDGRRVLGLIENILELARRESGAAPAPSPKSE